MRKPLARHFARVCLPLTLALAASFASATVVTFDDLATDGIVPANYAGLDWSPAPGSSTPASKPHTRRIRATAAPRSASTAAAPPAPSAS